MNDSFVNIYDTTHLPNVVCTLGEGRLVRIQRLARTGFCECLDMFSNAEVLVHRSHLKPMPQIPAKYKEHMFARVAPHIVAALRAYPDCIEIDPSPYTLETLGRKLREAIAAKQQYSWKFPGLDDTRFAELSGELIAAETDAGTVLFGTRDAIKNHKIAGPKTDGEATVPGILLHDPTFEELESLCMLLHNKKLRPAPVIVVSSLTPQQVDSIEARYEIAVVPFEHNPKLFQLLS